MSKRGENIYKRKDGRWEGRYIISYDAIGKAKYGYVYGKSYTALKQKLNEKKGGLSLPTVLSTSNSVLYSEVLSDWLLSIKNSVKESTHARYENLIATHIVDNLGKYQASKISTQLIEAFIGGLLCYGRADHKGGLSAKTVAIILMILNKSMEYARGNGIEIICDFSRISVKKKDKEMRVLSPAEQNEIIAAIMSDLDFTKLGILLSLSTGIRIGELCALKWADIDLAQGVLKIRKTMQRIPNNDLQSISKTKIIITEPKTESSVRDIPLPKFWVKAAQGFDITPAAYLLTGEVDRFIEPRSLQNRFKKIINECGFDDVNFHALRHTFATRCVEVGFEIKALSEILGHSSVKITLDRYVHSSFDHKVSNMNKLQFGA